MAGTLHRVKRSQPKICDNLASRGVLRGTTPICPAGNCGEREAELSHHWQTPLLSPAPTHSESLLQRHRPGRWRNPQTTTSGHYRQDGSDAILLEAHGGKLCQSYGSGGTVSVRSEDHAEDGIQKRHWIWMIEVACCRRQVLMERPNLTACCIYLQ